jgi:hypothetical protein
MNRSAKIAAFGITAAIVLVAIGTLRTKHFERQEAALAKECASLPAHAQLSGQNPFDQFDEPDSSAAVPPLPPGYMLDPLVCDVGKLIRLGADKGIQGRLVDAHWPTEASRDMPIFLASMIAALSMLP